MYIVIIILLLLLFIVALVWYRYYSSNNNNSNDTTDIVEDEIVPTLHAKCNVGLGCGGELVCDTGNHRCKQPQGGNCSNNVDCMAGLHCTDWICSNNISDDSNDVEVSSNKKSSNVKPHIKWVDNQTFYYNIGA